MAAESGFPCTVPTPVTGQPFTIAGKVATVWKYIPEASSPPASAKDLARILRDLHSRPLPPSPPETLADPLASIATALRSATQDIMPPRDRDWLASRITERQRLGYPAQ